MIQKTVILFFILFFTSSSFAHEHETSVTQGKDLLTNLQKAFGLAQGCSEADKKKIARICDGAEIITADCYKKAFKCLSLNNKLDSEQLSDKDRKEEIKRLKSQKCPFVGQKEIDKWKELKKEHKEDLESIEKDQKDLEQKIIDLNSKILSLEEELNTELVTRNQKTQEAMEEWKLAEKELKENNQKSISALHKEFEELNRKRKDIIFNQYRKLKLAREEKLAELQAKCYQEALDRQMNYDQKKRDLKAVGLISKVSFSRNVHLGDKAKRLKRFHAYRLQCLKANKELKQKIKESYKHARVNLKREQKILLRSMISIQESIRSLSEKLPNDLQEKLSEYNKKTNLIETSFKAKQESLGRKIQLKNAELREVRSDLHELGAKKETILSDIENKKYMSGSDSDSFSVFDDLTFVTSRVTAAKKTTNSVNPNAIAGEQSQSTATVAFKCVKEGIQQKELDEIEKKVKEELKKYDELSPKDENEDPSQSPGDNNGDGPGVT